MRVKFKLLGVLLAIILFAVSGRVDAATDWNTNTITATGYGVPNPRFMSVPAQAWGMARTAAIADAQRNLLAAIKGINVDAETTVENMMTTSDIIKTKVSGLVKGARIIEEGEVPGGGYSVTMEIALFNGEGSLAETVIERPVKVEPLPVPPVDYRPPVDYTPPTIPDYQPPKQTSSGKYTGLVIDCRGLEEVNSAMSPVIKNVRGEIIFGLQYVDFDRLLREGLVSYARSMSKASRAGSNPLIVRAVSLEDFNTNPVLSKEDADMVLYENNSAHFLDNIAVVFLY